MKSSEFKSRMQSLMKKAWYLVKTYGISMSEGMKKAWAWSKVVYKMTLGVARFTFEKVDGSMRMAWGTLMDVPATEGGRKANEGIQVYFDREKDAWRCFKIINLTNVY